MSRAKAELADKPVGEATRPQDRDEAGRPVDGFGLPLNAAARAAALGDKPDPAVEADREQTAPPLAPALTE